MLVTSLSRALTLIALFAGLLLGVAAPQALARDAPPNLSPKPKPRLKLPDVRDPAQFGEWIADLERPAELFRGRYGLRLAEARAPLR